MRKYTLLLAALLFAGCDLGLAEGEVEGQGKIAGTVVEVPRGEPMSNVEVRVEIPGTTTAVLTSETGTYLVTRLSPANYFVTVRPPNGYELAPGTLNGVPVQIEADETKMVNFQLRVRTSTSEPPQARN